MKINFISVDLTKTVDIIKASLAWETNPQKTLQCLAAVASSLGFPQWTKNTSRAEKMSPPY